MPPSADPIKILLIEDNDNDADLLQRALLKSNVVITRAERMREAAPLLSEKRWDVILSDLLLPDSDRLDTLTRVQSLAAQTPIVILTGHDDEAMAIHAIQHGAQDYIVKGKMDGDMMLRVVHYAIERKRAEESLRESEDRYRDLVENSQDLICTHDLEGRILSFNLSAEKMLGYPAETLRQMNIRDIIVPGVRPVFETYIAILRRRGKARGIMHIQTRNGEQRIWEYNNTVRTEGVAQPIVRGMARDVTERKQAEDEIRQRNEDLALINAINAAVNRNDSLTAIATMISEEVSRLFNGLGTTLHLVNADRSRLVRQNLALPPEMLAKIEKLLGIATLPIQHDLQKAHPFHRVLESKKAYLATEPQIQEFISVYTESLPLPALARAGVRKLVPALIKLLGLRSQLVIPLISGNEVIGVLDIGSRELFTENDLRRLETLAGQLTMVIERKRVEEEVENREKRFHALIRNGRDNISLLAADGTLLWESPSVDRTLGYAPDQFKGHNIFELMHPDDQAWARNMYAQVVRTPSKTQEGVFRLLHADESWRWIECSATNLLNEPSVQSIVINYRDITERKRADEALQESESRLRLIVEGTQALLVSVDANGHFVYANEAAARAVGYASAEELIGKPYLHFIYPEDRQQVLDTFAQQVNARQPSSIQEFRLTDTQGNVRCFSFLATLTIKDGQVVGQSGVAQDITARKRSEEALRKAEGNYRNIFENAMEAIVQTTPEGRYITANPATLRILGYDSFEELITSVNDLNTQFYVEPGRRQEFKKLMEEQGAVVGFESEVYRKDGSRVWVSENMYTVRDEQGILLYYEGTSEDITKRKKAEEEIKKQLEELQRWHDATLGREGRILDLKREVNELLGKDGKPPRYASAELENQKEK